MAVYGTLKTKDGTPVYLHSALTGASVTVDGKEYSLTDIVTALVKAPVEQVSNSRDADIEANVAYTVPEYVVGCGNIAIYLDGVRVFAGADNDFVEVGTTNAPSTTVTFNKSVAKDVQIVARVENFIPRVCVCDETICYQKGAYSAKQLATANASSKTNVYWWTRIDHDDGTAGVYVRFQKGKQLSNGSFTTTTGDTGYYIASLDEALTILKTYGTDFTDAELAEYEAGWRSVAD